VSNEKAPGIYKAPLSRKALLGIFAAVVVFHVGGGYALTLIDPPTITVGDTAPLEVSFVTPEAPAEQEIPPPPDDPPPPDIPPPPPLDIAVAPPDDLPPPEFKVEAPPPDPPKPEPPKPEPPKPIPPKPTPPKPVPPKQVTQPRPPAPNPSAEAQPSSAPVQTAARSPGPQTVSAAQVGYLTRPSPIYPSRSKRAGDQGTVMVKVLVDPTGRPSQVVLQASSGHPELDESALSAVRAARFRPFTDAGVAQAVWVLCPIGFALQ
jgi:periplasmic protein TonB